MVKAADRAMPHTDQAQGFTLVELMIAIAIVGLLAVLAAPSFTEFTASQRVKASASSLFVSMLRARSEAIKSNASVSMAPIGSGWSEGWTVQKAGVTVDRHDIRGRLTISGPASLQYKGSGRLSAAVQPFEVAAPGTSSKRCITISLSGQPVNKKGGC